MSLIFCRFTNTVNGGLNTGIGATAAILTTGFDTLRFLIVGGGEKEREREGRDRVRERGRERSRERGRESEREGE